MEFNINEFKDAIKYSLDTINYALFNLIEDEETRPHIKCLEKLKREFEEVLITEEFEEFGEQELTMEESANLLTCDRLYKDYLKSLN